MTTRNDKLRRLAAIVRADQHAALFVVGWYAAAASENELDDLLTAVQELGAATGRADHLAVYRERWGRTPTPQ